MIWYLISRTKQTHNLRIIEKEQTMKNTGIVRRLDELGRITLPIELRRTLGVDERDPLEIF